MKELLVSGVNDWLLNASPKDPRYKQMQALRDVLQGAPEKAELFISVAEEMEKPTPVARGFAFDFEMSESQAESVDWTLANAPAEDKWRQVLNLLASYTDVVITYGESGGPYNEDNEDED